MENQKGVGNTIGIVGVASFIPQNNYFIFIGDYFGCMSRYVDSYLVYTKWSSCITFPN